jgi:tetratricopeptide (TPR) repeat protein
MPLPIPSRVIFCCSLFFTGTPAVVYGQASPQMSPKQLQEQVLNNSNDNKEGEQKKPIYISGQVALSDGAQPSARIAIERVCTNHTYQEGYVDSKGHFNIQLATMGSTLPDASFDNPARFGDGTRVGSTGGSSGTGQDSVLWGCNIRAALSGYRSNVVPLEGRRLSTNPDIGTLILTRLGKVDGYTISVTLALAPKDAKKAFEKGLDLEHHDKIADAQKEFQHAIEIYPQHAAAWYELGRTYEHANQGPQARDAYQKALEADPNYVNPSERMYVLAIRENKWQEAADFSDKVLRLDPYEFGNAWYYNSLAHLQLHELDIAEKSAREAVKQTGKDAAAKAPYMLALVLANKGAYQEAAENFRAYLKIVPPGPDKDRTEKMLADVEQRLQASGTPK